MLEHAVVKRIDGFARLERSVRVMRRAANDRMFRRKCAAAVRRNQVVIDHRAQNVVVEQLNFGDLVRGAEAIEEMQERQT